MSISRAFKFSLWIASFHIQSAEHHSETMKNFTKAIVPFRTLLMKQSRQMKVESSCKQRELLLPLHPHYSEWGSFLSFPNGEQIKSDIFRLSQKTPLACIGLCVVSYRPVVPSAYILLLCLFFFIKEPNKIKTTFWQLSVSKSGWWRIPHHPLL